MHRLFQSPTLKRLALLVLFAGLGMTAWSPAGSSAADSAYEVVHGWPKLPTGFALGQVTGVAVDSKNRVFVFHRKAKPILCIDGDTGEILNSFGDFGNAHGLSIDANDNIWVTDIGRHLIYQYSPDGRMIKQIGRVNEAGDDELRFNKPTDVEVGPDGHIYVTDGYVNSRVVKLTPEGDFVKQWGTKGSGKGQFDIPHGLTIDAQGRVYVADRANARVQVFDSEGAFLDEWKSDALGRPWGLDVMEDGSILVADGGDMTNTAYDRNRALRVNPQGEILDVWGSFGSQDGQFYWAHDIAAGPDGSVYVVDVNVGMRVQKFVRK